MGKFLNEGASACFQESSPCFLSVICFWRNYLKSLIPLSDLPVRAQSPPCFSWKISLFSGEKQGSPAAKLMPLSVDAGSHSLQCHKPADVIGEFLQADLGFRSDNTDRPVLVFHPDKTRLIEFGRFAANDRKLRGLGKPETFAFLGFTFICGRSRRGNFQLQRKTRRDRMRRKLGDIKAALRRRMHQPIPEQGKWLRQVVAGHFAYYVEHSQSASQVRSGRHTGALARRRISSLSNLGWGMADRALGPG